MYCNPLSYAIHYNRENYKKVSHT